MKSCTYHGRTTAGGICWGDLLSRWRKVGTNANGEVAGSLDCRTIVVDVSADADCALPLKNSTKNSQLRGLAAYGPLDEVTTLCGTARCNTKRLFRLSQGTRQVMLIPAENESLQAKLMVCTHMDGCHCGKVSMLHMLRPYCVRHSMEADGGSLSGSVYIAWVARRES